MPRRQVKRGGRKFQPEKPLIYVFCEGESEQAYAKFLKEHFADVAVLKIPSKTGLFSKAKNDFDKEPKYRNYAEVTDEIWVLAALLDDGLPSLDDTDERNRWLCQCGKTFTTVQEAIVFLESLRQ